MLAIHPRQASACELFSAKGSQGAKLEHAELAWTLDPMDHGYLTLKLTPGAHPPTQGGAASLSYNIIILQYYTDPRRRAPGE